MTQAMAVMVMALGLWVMTLIRVLARSAEALMEAIIRLRHLESGGGQGFLAEILTCTAVAPKRS